MHGQRRRGKSLLREPRSPPSTPSAGVARDASERRAARSRSRRAGTSARADSARLQKRQVDCSHRGGRQLRKHRRGSRGLLGRPGLRVVRRHLIVAALALLSAGTGGNPGPSLRATASVYLAHIAVVAPVAGRDTTYDYYQRLLEDADILGDSTVPGGYDPARWSQPVSRFASLDLSLAEQLIAASYVPLTSVRGLGEVLVRSSVCGTMEPEI